MQTLEEVQEKVRANGKAAPTLKWRKLNDYSVVSECGEFYIGKAFVSGEPRYDVWFKKQGGTAMQLRMNLPSADDAKSWASSVANAYKKGQINLKAPLSIDEVKRLKETAGAG